MNFTDMCYTEDTSEDSLSEKRGTCVFNNTCTG
jgi:hypothetical protein